VRGSKVDEQQCTKLSDPLHVILFASQQAKLDDIDRFVAAFLGRNCLRVFLIGWQKARDDWVLG
jgi:hypothetical protein